jgi:hypothetical protein
MRRADLRFQEPEKNKDVHTEHCCVRHSCKYGEDDFYCTVRTKKKRQSFVCESCEEEGITNLKILHAVMSGTMPSCPHCGHVLKG